jgi:DNA repair protein RecN (Recombination protein N)
MLTHLVIRNFAIIDHLELPLAEGLTVITGETGAGKSILVDALNLLLGGRASLEVIRAGAEEAVVEGIFEPCAELLGRLNSALTLQGIEVAEQVIVRRIVSRSGRNKVFVNGCATRLDTLRVVTRGLVDISGQHEHQSLLEPSRHVEFLDAFAGLTEDRLAVAEGVARLRALGREVEELQRGERARLTQLDFLRFQLKEIDEARLDASEEESLAQECQRLRHAERLSEVALSAYHSLYEAERSAVDVVSEVCSRLERAVRFDARIGKLQEGLESARIVLSEVASDLRDYAEGVEADPMRLLALTERQDLIDRLKRKHGDSVAKVLVHAEEMRRELGELESAESRVEEALTERASIQRVVMAQARTLSERRKRAARRLEELVVGELGQLGMGGCKFEVQIVHKAEGGEVTQDVHKASAAGLNLAGIDEVEFLIAPNLGEPPRSMARIASGGELSRIMLAIKGVLLRSDIVETYIFDEVDTGIGGRTAEIVGRKIKDVSRSRQVVCITHLPQIAAFADWHVLVEKRNLVDKTVSSLRLLDPRERVREVARMLGGVTLTQRTLDHAEEMIGKAERGDGELAS